MVFYKSGFYYTWKKYAFYKRLAFIVEAVFCYYKACMFLGKLSH